ncbi:hypothetical protein TREAZ_0759 [Leadbettera azotonutricia ZAS-9]|uniref:Uncharacterized protein n=1 Tax=Leadbettera azotonutricia (strain ATCC BAA-888 / DSM 13862 / ZAS-9) TaxID=545695 RepID=F5YA75_LEAAZ|nr:hypothetical protein TREAZ_0759 [Leadbettera azotonutricia ZAS-9]
MMEAFAVPTTITQEFLPGHSYRITLQKISFKAGCAISIRS